MPNLQWSKLSPLQLGRYAEYYAKMEFASYGYDVYTSEVDDHGVDFVVKSPLGRFLEIQVKSYRCTGYVFMKKDRFRISEGSILNWKDLTTRLRWLNELDMVTEMTITSLR